MVREIGGSQNVLAVYGRQQFYADRTVELKIPKTVQIGATERITLSPEAQAIRMAQSGVAASQNVSVSPASVFMYNQPVRQLTYDDPRKATTRFTHEDNTSVDQAEPDSDKDDSDFTPGIETAGESQGGASAGPR